MSNTTIIRGFGGTILGQIEEDSSGNKIVRAFGGRILGKYNKSDNTTRTFGGVIVAYGDIASGFLMPKNLLR